MSIDRCPICGAWRWQGRCQTPHADWDPGPDLSKPTFDWRERAKCARPGINADLWYTATPLTDTQAKEVCQTCPVRHPCLRAGLRDEHGVWGGWAAHERRRLVAYLTTAGTINDPRALERPALLGPVPYRMTGPVPTPGKDA